MKLKQRIISFLLSVITVFTLLPIEALAGGLWQAGVSTGGSSSGGSGNWGTEKQGYRISIIDPKTATTVTNKVDFVFGNAPINAVYCSNNKIEGYWADRNKYEARESNLQIISTSDSRLLEEFNKNKVNPNWPKHTLWSGGAQSNGAFKDWFLKGELKTSGGGTGSKLPPSYSGAGNTSYKPSGGSSSSGSGSGSSSGSISGAPSGGQSGSQNSVSAKCSEIRNSMQREFDLKIKAGMSRGAAAAAAEKRGYGIVCDLELADAFTPDELKRMNAEVKKYANHLAAPDSAAGSVWVSPFSPAYNDFSNQVETIEVNKLNNTIGNAFLDIAYAADPEYDSTADGAAYVIMNYKMDGNFVFAFNNGTPLMKDKDGNDSIIETVCGNDYYILVEPVYWFIPEKWRESPEPKHYSPYIDTFYGTPTNYGQFTNEVSKVWNDRTGAGGNYGNLVNKVGAHTLHLGPKDTLYKHDASGNPTSEILIEGVSSTNSTIANKTLANNKKGYAVNYFWGKAPDGWDPPSTQTYDPFEKDPNPDPHKAPNPDPNYKAPSGKTPVPFTEGEPQHPKENPPDTPEKGYKEITRTINIVKVYDIEHIDGSIEHVKTEARRWNPGTIAVNQEPDYKVIGYYTSPYYIGWELFQPWQIIMYPGENHYPELNIDYTSDYYMPIQAHLSSNEDIGDWDDTEESKASWVRPEISTEWKDMREWVESISSEFGVTKKFDFDNKIEFNEEAEAGEVVGTVQIGVVADLEYDSSTGKIPKEGYDDTTLYVHLIKKEKIPETSTWDGNPPGDTPPPDPFKDPQTDPETTPDIDPENPFLNHEIVKVYQVKDWSNWQDGMPEPEWEHVSTYYQYPTAPIVTVENEKDYQLTEWKAAWGIPNPTDKTPPEDIITPQVTGSTDWEDAPIKNVSPFKSGVQPAKVEIFDKNNPKKSSTIYVLLRKEIPPEPPGDGAIIIQQSQITKTVRTNDIKIANKMASMNWGNYSFHYQIGDFADPPHSFSHPHYPTGRHSCTHTPNDRWVDNELNLWFHQLTAKQDIQVPDGKFNKTDNAVYSGNANKGIIHKRDEDITKLSGMNLYDYVSDGKSEKGEELVTVLWRQGLNDKPILAKYKEKDITSGNGYILKGVSATNWTDSLAIVDKADRKAGGQRALDNGFELTDLNFTFGLQQGEGDQQGTSECRGCTCHGCHAPIQNTKYLEVRSGNWAEDFLAVVCVRTYKGRDKAIAAQPNGMGASPQKDIKVTPGKHVANNIIQGKQTIKFYPYIRMTYMINNLDDATKEAQNTDSTGYKQDVRKDTYVISEYESGILPNDAVTVGWENPKDGESLLLTSQQWSVHKKATSQVSGVTTSGWQGKNQVLPGGAIYQLSTPDGSRTTVNLTTYQTVVDEKARAEYLTSTSTLTGDEYTVKKVTEDHLSFVNDAKEILDNLKIVQWVHNPGTSGGNKFSSNDKAYPNNFDETANGYICLFHNGNPRDDAQTSLSQLDNKLTRKPSTDSKYYMHAANIVTEKNGKLSNTGTLADYQNSTKLSDITSTIIKNDAKQSEPTQGDLDITKIHQETTVYKVFTDTSGNVYMISDKRSGASHIDQVEADINAMIASMKDINADTYDKWSGKKEILAAKDIAAKSINGVLTNDAKEIDDRTSFITNIALSVIRNSGTDKTAEWVNGPTEGRWYNEGFDGIYLVKQYTKMEVAFAFTDKRSSALDPALCPQNKGQSDLYTNAYLSQFLVDSHSDAKIANGKPDHYIGTFKDVDILMPDMESMYVSKKFWIPNANVQDLN